MKKHPVHSPRIREEKYILDPAEIENPTIVFNDLFSAYHLSDLREKLRDLMDSALTDTDCDAQSYFFLFRHLEKLIEASYVMTTSVKYVSRVKEAPSLTIDESLDEKFYKPPRIDEIAQLRPLEALEKTFAIIGANDLMEELDRWRKCIMTGDFYKDPTERENVWAFCDQLMCLIESAHLYLRDKQPSEKNEMENFYMFFTFTYARRTLWDCFEAILTDDREEECNGKSTIAQTYRCLLSVIVGTYYLLEESPGDSVMMYEKKAV